MNREENEEKIKWVKDTFERKLAYELGLLRVSGPMIVKADNGVNDDLGISSPASFFTTYCGRIQIVQSLAKWKRLRLKDFDSKKYSGIYVDMNAIRPDEKVDRLHSYYVDQWDWERIINKKDRNIKYLEEVVKTIHRIINSYFDMDERYFWEPFFITSEELYNMYPELTPREREYKIVKEKGVVFIEKIGHILPNGERHDLRADDYDDWNLNGDLIYWSKAIEAPLEISSMGIRVDADSLKEQLKISGNEHKATSYDYHKMILNNELPLTIGGGIGQSRLCMLIMQKRHIGEVQSSVWPEDEIEKCNKEGINLL